MAKRRPKLVSTRPQGVHPRLWDLAKKPENDLGKVWRSLGRDVRFRIASRFFDILEPADKDAILEPMSTRSGHSIDSLYALSSNELAEVLETLRVPSGIVGSILLAWILANEDDRGIWPWKALVDEEDVPAERSQEYVSVHFNSEKLLHLPTAAELMPGLFFLLGFDDTVIFLLFFRSFEPPLRAQINRFLLRLTTEDLADIHEEGRAVVAEHTDEDDRSLAEVLDRWLDTRYDFTDLDNPTSMFVAVNDAADDLTTSLTRLSDEVASALIEERLPNPGALTGVLRDASRIIALRGHLEDLLDDLEVATPTIDTLTQPDGILAIVETIEEWGARLKESSTSARALNVLATVERLRSSGPDGLLEPVINAARDAQEQLAGEDRSEIAERLIDGSHKVPRFVRAVEQAATANAEEKLRITADLQREFGAELALAVALGQITLEAREDDVSKTEAHITAETSNLEQDEEAELPVEPEQENETLVEPTTGAAETPAEEEDSDAEPEGALEASPVEEPAPEEFVATAEMPEPTAPSDEGEPHPDKSTPAYCPAEGASLQQVASEILEQPTLTTTAAEHVALNLLERGKRTLAYHVVNGAGEQDTAKPRLPAWLLVGVALGPHLRSASGPVASALRTAYANFDASVLNTGDVDWDEAVALLLTAATLRPSLLAPMTFAPQILQSVGFKHVSTLWKHCTLVASKVITGTSIDPSTVARVQSQANWEEEVASLRSEVREWSSRATTRRIRFPAATAVWQAWLRGDGIIHELLQPIATNEFAKAGNVRSLIELLQDPAEFRRLVDGTDREVATRVKWQPIQHKAFAQLQSYVDEAIAFAEQWLQLVDLRPGERHNYRVALADEIRRDIAAKYPKIREELEALVTSRPTAPIRAGVAMVEAALNDVERMFEPGATQQTEERSVDRRMNASLLRSSAIFLGEDWQIDGASPEQTARAVLEMLAKGHSPTWVEVYEERMLMEDHIGSDLALQIIEASDTSANAEELRRRRTRELEATSRTIARLAADALNQVEHAVMHGLLGEEERVDLAGRVTRVENAITTSLRFHRLRAELEDVVQQVERRREEQVQRVREQLESRNDSKKDKARVLAVLDSGDVHTAQEYLHYLEQGLPLPAEDTVRTNAFDDFFPDALAKLEAFLPPNRAQLIDVVLGKQEFPEISYAGLTKAQAEEAAEVFRCWYRIRARKGSTDASALTTLFGYFGFDNVTVTDSSSAGNTRAWAEIQTDPVRDRTRCPLPTYGSFAAGDATSTRARYRVLTVWGEPSPDDLIDALSDTVHGPPTWVLYCGRLNAERRRAIAHLSRTKRRTFLVVDEYLLAYLAAHTGSRMAALFACTTPFTTLEPFQTKSVPPEMFYGREAERNSIMDPHGTSIIFGGRQLGKTALLRHVERLFHSPETGQIAIYLDLKYGGIGIDRPADDIWPMIADALRENGIVDVSSQAADRKILDAARSWLEADSERRILLLLDEADRFFEADKDFARVARFKGLMDVTDRRFKVVFAGLHNVQRMTRVANNSLAHLGQPINIGPLFENGEWRAARALIEEPLKALGYEFESSDLVTRIVSQTNYYPSLVQLYGVHLLQHVTRADKELFDPRTSPPYVITAKMVEDVYLSKDLWHHIRIRWRWTLELDERFRVFAMIIALQTSLDDEVAREGMQVSAIHEEALSMWPQGFREDRSVMSTRVLLDEMVGLGVLRHTDSDGYTLRSANVGLLMGSVDELERGLLEQTDREPPAVYDPATFRRPLTQSGVRRYSPLTYEQEAVLQERDNGVSIVFGSKASGIRDIPVLFSRLFDKDYHVPLSGVKTLEAFQDALGEMRSRKRDGVTVYHVDESAPWDLSWVNVALDRLSALRSKTSFARVVFSADPGKADAILRSVEPSLADLERKGVSLITLRPWAATAVRNWLDDQEVPVSEREQMIGDITEITGKWPALVYALGSHLSEYPLSRWPSALKERNGIVTAIGGPDLFGLGEGAVTEVLNALHTFERASADELATLLERDLNDVERTLAWAERLAMTERLSDGTWIVDPAVGRSVG